MSERTAKAFEKGKLAYSNGNALGNNPYTHETTIQSANNRAWTQGWRTAATNDSLLDPDEREELLNTAQEPPHD